ncbi:similar to Saccharomyces cerevisiae YGR136W LSB1 Protein containing an N-terminal SH3 domain [Maudiozyma saulgeensis]|uniref:Similar to Saccharomyces cerevisiae YGR136W LSB1 Protein containing an N-terminal SH3 domain n=1 Tax=Maudiozyma saulgeensis TaxID=1789683 RepID=A0A1X7QX73_9SACH|nr:similar to Saccharomyces cerevisiae YGR136W LSB1 Protein containing an N-terminal SH3 domain [Kazachstania saulgeensis]
MSASLINRSLTNIRTELDFLRESNVISDDVFNRINDSLPEKYDPNSSRDNSNSNQEEYVEAIYDFPPQQDGDLELKTGDKIQIIEKPSNEWYKGKCNGKVGMFPSNYVKPAFSNTAPKDSGSVAGPPRYANDNKLEQQYTNHSSQASYQQSSQQQSPYPPPSTNYYQQTPPQQIIYQSQPQPQPQQVVVEQPQQHSNGSSQMKKFGSKLGNAAIFGAGATLGSDLVNSIF